MFRLMCAALLTLLMVGSADACRRHRRSCVRVIVMPCQPSPLVFIGPPPAPTPTPLPMPEKKGPESKNLVK